MPVKLLRLLHGPEGFPQCRPYEFLKRASKPKPVSGQGYGLTEYRTLRYCRMTAANGPILRQPPFT